MKTSKLLSQDLPVQDEEIVEAVKVPEVIDVVTPTRNPQENEVSAYACAIPKCNKVNSRSTFSASLFKSVRPSVRHS